MCVYIRFEDAESCASNLGILVLKILTGLPMNVLSYQIPLILAPVVGSGLPHARLPAMRVTQRVMSKLHATDAK